MKIVASVDDGDKADSNVHNIKELEGGDEGEQAIPLSSGAMNV
jgi:hypothetical protein